MRYVWATVNAIDYTSARLPRELCTDNNFDFKHCNHTLDETLCSRVLFCDD